MTNPARALDCPADWMCLLNDLADIIRQTDDTCTKRRPAIELFGELLKDRGEDDGSIVLQQYWALFFDVSGKYSLAIKHRKRVIELVHELVEVAGFDEIINKEYLLDEMELLHGDYVHLNDIESAAELRRRISQLKGELDGGQK